MSDNEWSRPSSPPPDYHPIYGEAQTKNYLAPIRIYALVEWTSYSTSYLDGVGIDKENSITVSFHRRRLVDDQNLFVRVGDFVLYGDIYYEIVKLEEPQKLFGQVDHDFEIKVLCKKTRKGLFNG